MREPMFPSLIVGTFVPPAALSLLLAMAVAGPASAENCAEAKVTARGEPASFEWLARANWRARVRALPALGDAYANFDRARESNEWCTAGPTGTVCQLEAIPCRKD
ncbi:MAG: hypothetical protein NW217_10355 [Hyphomicrobiaceae bacterium]|nr:hypothetical protein [Hyphomicrobiaceae bacterium]